MKKADGQTDRETNRHADRQTDRQLAINAITSVSPVEEYVARKEELRP